MDDLIGCSSHMCLIQKPKGVGTNGPCLCNARKLRLKLTWQDVRIEQLKDDCIIKDKRIDWTVADNVKKAIEIADWKLKYIAVCEKKDLLMEGK